MEVSQAMPLSLGQNFARHDLDEAHAVYVGQLPEALLPSPQQWENLWNLLPPQRAVTAMRGAVRIPRWQQTYERTYPDAGAAALPQPAPPELQPLWQYAREQIDPRLNGLLVSWYDGRAGHYLGPHHDQEQGLVPGSPIVMISLGEPHLLRMTRTFNFREQAHDFPTPSGTVLLLPAETNRTWKHSLPRFPIPQGRRMMITLRAFAD